MVFLTNSFLLRYYILSTLLFLLLYVLSVYIKSIRVYNDVSHYFSRPDKGKEAFSMMFCRLLVDHLLDFLVLLLPVFRVFCIILFYAIIKQESRNISETITNIIETKQDQKKNEDSD